MLWDSLTCCSSTLAKHLGQVICYSIGMHLVQGLLALCHLLLVEEHIVHCGKVSLFKLILSRSVTHEQMLLYTSLDFFHVVVVVIVLFLSLKTMRLTFRVNLQGSSPESWVGYHKL